MHQNTFVALGLLASTAIIVCTIVSTSHPVCNSAVSVEDGFPSASSSHTPVAQVIESPNGFQTDEIMKLLSQIDQSVGRSLEDHTEMLGATRGKRGASWWFRFGRLDVCKNNCVQLGFARENQKAKMAKGMQAFSPADQLYLSQVVAQPEYIALAEFTELGCAAGLTSLTLGMMARLRGGRLKTFDIKDMRYAEVRQAWLDNMDFNLEDILGDKSKPNPVVAEALARAPGIALFDNGDKPWECNNYAEFMPKGSLLFTHDWGNEVSGKDVDKIFKILGFELVQERLALDIGTHLRAFQRK